MRRITQIALALVAFEEGSRGYVYHSIAICVLVVIATRIYDRKHA